MGLVRIMTRVS